MTESDADHHGPRFVIFDINHINTYNTRSRTLSYQEGGQLTDYPTPMAPRLFFQNDGDAISAKVSATLSVAPTHTVVRLTGGCGLMSEADARGVENLIVPAFEGFSGSLLFGGTRMLIKDDPRKVHWGITELAPLIQTANPTARVVGVVARGLKADIQLDPRYGLVVSDNEADGWVTIVHPLQNVCMVLQHNADKGTVWDTEWQFCREIIDVLSDAAGFRKVLLAYNGGGVTKREVTAWAESRWPVVLIRDSGRACDEFAADRDWLAEHPSVRVAEKTTQSIREHLVAAGTLPAGTRELRLVRHGA